MCVYGIKQHQHASVFVCMFTWETCLIHTSHSNYFNVRKKKPKQTSRWCFYFWRPHRKRVRTRVSLTVVGVVPERAVKSCSGSDLKSDNLRWRVLFMCLLLALPGSLDGGDSCGSEPTAVRFSLAGTSPTAVRCQVSLDTQGHFNSTVATLAFFLSIEEIQRVFLRLSDVARFCKHGQKRRLMPPPSPPPTDDVSLRVIFTCRTRTPSSAEGPNKRRRKGNQLLTFDAFISIMASFPDLLVKSAASSCWKTTALLVKVVTTPPPPTNPKKKKKKHGERPMNFDFAERCWRVPKPERCISGVHQVQVCDEHRKPSICHYRAAAAMLLGN